jgi:small-conductance mechanosensitive channel
VLAEPAPSALLTGFGDNGLNLELGVWIRNPQEGTMGVRSDIALALLAALRAHAIEIPFPQRDVRILTGAASEAASVGILRAACGTG